MEEMGMVMFQGSTSALLELIVYDTWHGVMRLGGEYQEHDLAMKDRVAHVKGKLEARVQRTTWQ